MSEDRIKELEFRIENLETVLAREMEEKNAAWSELTQTRKERDEAQKNYQFMVDRAADEHLDGYREMGDNLAKAHENLDRVKSERDRYGEVLEKIAGYMCPTKNDCWGMSCLEKRAKGIHGDLCYVCKARQALTPPEPCETCGGSGLAQIYDAIQKTNLTIPCPAPSCQKEEMNDLRCVTCGCRPSERRGGLSFGCPDCPKEEE